MKQSGLKMNTSRLSISLWRYWLAVAALFRISSLAALVALAASPGFALAFAGPEYAIMAAGLAVLGFYRHKTNIIRLIRGEEPRIGGKKKDAE